MGRCLTCVFKKVRPKVCHLSCPALSVPASVVLRWCPFGDAPGGAVVKSCTKKRTARSRPIKCFQALSVPSQWS